MTLQQQLSYGFIVLSDYHRGSESALRASQDRILEDYRKMAGENISLELLNPIVADEFPKQLRYCIVE